MRPRVQGWGSLHKQSVANNDGEVETRRKETDRSILAVHLLFLKTQRPSKCSAHLFKPSHPAYLAPSVPRRRKLCCILGTTIHDDVPVVTGFSPKR